MKLILSFLTILCILCLSTACAYEEDDLEWACGKSKELHLGEGITCGNYTVVAYNFPRSGQKQFVGLKLYENNILVADQTLTDGEDYIHDDEIRITALELWMTEQDWTDLPTDQWAKVRIEPRGLPRFEVEFETEKDEYEPYSSIEMDLIIHNIGDAEADDVNVYVDVETLETFEMIRGMTRYHCSEIEKGGLFDSNTDTASFDPITLRFGVPSVIEDTACDITVNIECYDIKGIKYCYSGSYPLKVFSMFKISKSINDNIYMDEVANVTVSLRNEGTRPINSIVVSDTLPPDFELNDNSPLQWELDLGAGESRSFSYSLKPMQPNVVGYVIPAAIVEWNMGGRTYSVRSDSPSISVYGPKIELSKTVNPSTIHEAGIVTVTIEVTNTGNVLASIDVADSIPETAVLIDGISSSRTVIAAGESHTFGYNMQMNMAGSVELPPAVVHFADTHDYAGTVVSENVSIMVNPAVHSARTVDTPDQTTSTVDTANTTAGTAKESDTGSVCTLVGFLAAVFVIMRVKRT